MKIAISLAAALFLALPVHASAQHEHAAAGAGQVGSDSVSFVTSCAPALRQDFNRAVALLHSFWFAQAIAAFDGVSAKDPVLRDGTLGRSAQPMGQSIRRASLAAAD